MALEAHIHELSEKHRNLDRMIAEEVVHPACDDIKLAKMKREKLRLRDLIEELTGGETIN